MSRYFLETAITRYKADWFTFLADSGEAENRGESTDHLVYDNASSLTLENWVHPAESMPEAIAALELALADYEVGETPRIPAMVNAALAWMRAEFAERRKML